jgi:hypothetical protein
MGKTSNKSQNNRCMISCLLLWMPVRRQYHNAGGERTPTVFNAALQAAGIKQRLFLDPSCGQDRYITIYHLYWMQGEAVRLNRRAGKTKTAARPPLPNAQQDWQLRHFLIMSTRECGWLHRLPGEPRVCIPMIQLKIDKQPGTVVRVQVGSLGEAP